MCWISALPFALLIAAAPGQERIAPGTYEFKPLLTLPPGYACREVWIIGKDNTLRFESGQQRTLMRVSYRYDWLGDAVVVFTPVETNGLPDCNGNRRDSGDDSVRSFKFTLEADGAIRLCHLSRLREDRETIGEDGVPLPGSLPPEPGLCPGSLHPLPNAA